MLTVPRRKSRLCGRSDAEGVMTVKVPAALVSSSLASNRETAA